MRLTYSLGRCVLQQVAEVRAARAIAVRRIPRAYASRCHLSLQMAG